MPVVVMPVTIGEGARQAAVSSIVRVFEETGAKYFYILYTRRAGEGVASSLKELFNGTFLRINPYLVSDEPGITEHEVRKLLVRLKDSGPVYVVPTPGSRRLAAAVTMAADEANACILHVDFYWGPWTGLPYPLVPRVFEPLYVLRCDERPHPADDQAAVEGLLRQVGGELLNGISSELRRKVAQEALNTNLYTASNPVARRYPRAPGGSNGYCGQASLELHVRGNLEGKEWSLKVRVNDWCSDSSWVRAASKMLDQMESPSLAAGAADAPILRDFMEFLARASGLKRLVFRAGGEKLEPRGEVVIDTNLVYWGVHNECLSAQTGGFKPVIPYAVLAEIYRRYAEALKPLPYGGRLQSLVRRIEDILARYMLDELRRSCGAPLIPSPQPPADTAIPSIDVLLLEGKYIATADRGAYKLWEEHPVRRIARPLLASTEPVSESVSGPLQAARAAYAIYQLAAMLRIVQGLGRSGRVRSGTWLVYSVRLDVD